MRALGTNPLPHLSHSAHTDSTGGDNQALQPVIAVANNAGSTLPPESTTAAVRCSRGTVPASTAYAEYVSAPVLGLLDLAQNGSPGQKTLCEGG